MKHPTIPQAVAAGDKLTKVTKLVEADFNLLDAPATFRRGSSPGSILAAASRTTPDYRKEIQRISEKALAPVAEVEAIYRSTDDYSAAILRACHHIEAGHPLGEMVDENLYNFATTIRRAVLAQVIDQQEADVLVKRTRQQIKEAMGELSIKSAYTRRARRAIKKAILANTVKTVDAILSVKNLTMSSLEKSRLRNFGAQSEKRCEQFTEAYRETYYSKGKRGGYKKDIPPYRFRSLAAL